MTNLALGAAVYFDHELAADSRPLVTLWSRLATQPGLRSWSLTATKSTKPIDFNVAQLTSRVESGETTVVGVESHDRNITIIAQTTPAASLAGSTTSRLAYQPNGLPPSARTQ